MQKVPSICLAFKKSLDDKQIKARALPTKGEYTYYKLFKSFIEEEHKQTFPEWDSFNNSRSIYRNLKKLSVETDKGARVDPFLAPAIPAAPSPAPSSAAGDGASVTSRGDVDMDDIDDDMMDEDMTMSYFAEKFIIWMEENSDAMQIENAMGRCLAAAASWLKDLGPRISLAPPPGPLRSNRSHISDFVPPTSPPQFLKFLSLSCFSPGRGAGTSKFDLSGSKSPRGLIQSCGGWNRINFSPQNGFGQEGVR